VGEVDAITPIQSLTVGNLDMMKVTTSHSHTKNEVQLLID
jgi:hypothetical protein